MANLNFPAGTPSEDTKLVGFESPVAYGERTYTLAALAAFLGSVFVKRGASSNATGNSTLSIASSTRIHTEVITVTGDPRTSEIALPVTGREDGDRVTVRFENTVGGVTLNLRNATVAGTVIYSCYSTDGNAVFEVYFDGSAFQPLSNLQPVS